MVDAIHYDQLQRHGGRSGIKDENALESALSRARQKNAYKADADVFLFAAAYGFGLARKNGYSDGNKRVAFMAMYTFLAINGWEIVATELEVVQAMLEVSMNARDEAALSGWLREHAKSFVD